MSDPPGPVLDLAVTDLPSNPAYNSGESGDFPLDTSAFFEAWLEDLKPALEVPKPLMPAQLSVDDTPAPGELRFEGTLRVDCYVMGRLRSRTGTLIVTEPARVESDIIVGTAIIDGILHGDIHATERVELQSHARVIGNIESPAIAIRPGAIFEGQCHFLESSSSTDCTKEAPSRPEELS